MRLFQIVVSLIFGGLIGLTLRNIQYAKKEEDKKKYTRYFYLLLFFDAIFLILADYTRKKYGIYMP